LFEELLRDLRRLEGGVKIPAEIPVDDDGYFDRQCPDEQCHALFKILFADWKDKISDAEVYCPICRRVASATEWNTAEQSKYIEKVALAYMKGRIDRVLEADARRFNASQSPQGFFSLSLSYRPGARPVLVPPAAAEVMRQNHECDSCHCHYASIGAAFFCPCCGTNSAEKTFRAYLDAAEKTIRSIPLIRESLTLNAEKDAAQDTCRLVLENTQLSLIGALQHYVESLYSRLPSPPPARRNVFLNLKESSLLWKTAIGRDYKDLIGPSDYAELNRFFQQRHLIAHKNGFVDEDYIRKSGDTTYAVSQRLVISEVSMVRLLQLIRELAEKLAREIHS